MPRIDVHVVERLGHVEHRHLLPYPHPVVVAVLLLLDVFKGTVELIFVLSSCRFK